MTRETKFGLLLVLTLTSVFGFLVWKKMHQPKDLVATTQSTETADEEGETPPEQLDPPVNEDPTATPLAAIPAERPAPRRPTPPIDSSPSGEELFPAQPATTTVARPKPKLPVDLDGQEFFSPPKATAKPTAPVETSTAATNPDPFGPATDAPQEIRSSTTSERVDPFANPNEPVASTTNKTSAEPDPFADSVSNTAPTDRPNEFEPPAGTTVKEPDPFGSDTITIPERQPVVIPMPTEKFDSVATEQTTPIAEQPAEASDPLTRRVAVESVPVSEDPFGNAAAAVEITARSTTPATRAAVAAESVDPVLNLPVRSEPVATPTLAAKEPDPFFIEERTPEPIRAVPERQPPPRLRAAAPVHEPDPFGVPAAVPDIPVRAEPLPVHMEDEPFRMPARTAAPMAFSGEAYIVQPNDNFWTISKKVYGSGRYFEALAKYNANLVTDPTRMKPGLKIATPTTAELHSRFPQLLAAAGTQDTPQDPRSIGLPGDVYVAQSGDNFWEISKRLYGDGKYFRALEQHNSVIVNDPQKLKPGMKLAAPKAAWLHAKYPQLIASAAPAVQELRRLQPDRYQPDEPAGFFVGPGQQPMYRVGTRDTLSDIAQAYLGRSSRWIQILEMNRDVVTDGNALNVGTVLKLPADASRVVLIEDGSLRR